MWKQPKCPSTDKWVNRNKIEMVFFNKNKLRADTCSNVDDP